MKKKTITSEEYQALLTRMIEKLDAMAEIIKTIEFKLDAPPKRTP